MEKPMYNKMKVAPDATPSEQAVAHATNVVTRPGIFTTEWWTVIGGGGLSAILAAVGVSGPAAAQVAGIAAPAVLALVYAYARSQTKGALAAALKVVFPPAPAAAEPSPATQLVDAPMSAPIKQNGASAPQYQLLAVVPAPPN